jgi:hypothetical protein
MSITRVSSALVLKTVNQRLEGVDKYVKPKTGIVIRGKPIKGADVRAAYQAVVDGHSEVESKRAALADALARRESAEEARLEMDRGLQAWVMVTYGIPSPEATELGFVPRKVGTKTAETKHLATLQADATRKARGTIGKKKKQEIKGAKPVLTVSAEPTNDAPAVASAASALPASAPATHT